jgi:CheY-like chemotaxis protein
MKGTLMLVEPGETAQRSFREFFNALGYRVLVTGNPRRALTMCDARNRSVDCLVLSSHALGKEAVEAFNALSADPAYATLPAVLVAGETQTAVDAMARVDALRRVTRLPIRKREFAGLLEELLGVPRKPDPA